MSRRIGAMLLPAALLITAGGCGDDPTTVPAHHSSEKTVRLVQESHGEEARARMLLDLPRIIAEMRSSGTLTQFELARLVRHEEHLALLESGARGLTPGQLQLLDETENSIYNYYVSPYGSFFDQATHLDYHGSDGKIKHSGIITYPMMSEYYGPKSSGQDTHEYYSTFSVACDSYTISHDHDVDFRTGNPSSDHKDSSTDGNCYPE